MNCNLKSKNIALIALSFAVIIAMNNVSFAADEVQTAETNAVAALDNLEDDLLGIEEEAEKAIQETAEAKAEAEKAVKETAEAKAEAEKAVKETAEAVAEVKKEANEAIETINDKGNDLLDEVVDDITVTDSDNNLKADIKEAEAVINTDKENNIKAEPDDNLFAEEEELITPPSDLSNEVAKEDDTLSALDEIENDSLSLGETDSAKEEAEILPETDAPKSPFESFGNAILSKVDNDLFNQMSSIEKQTTLLRLEIKREELKNRVEALRNARLKAQEEEAMRKRAEEERLKDLEAARQAKILQEQKALREKEIELEKVRQGKVLNDYMNQMLLMNQKWIEENAILHNNIKELETERVELINNMKEKFIALNEEVDAIQVKANEAKSRYDSSINALNNQITQLRHAVIEAEDKLRQIQEGEEKEAADNDPNKPGKGAIDMSKEYAIMDITGKGDEVVAKIVSKDGTTFTVHKGTMLKNGEVVTSITDHYISFENNGVESYLYTGGTIMEYEPLVTFKSGERAVESPAYGSKAEEETKTKDANVDAKTENTVKQNAVRRRNISRPVSSSHGMFVK